MEPEFDLAWGQVTTMQFKNPYHAKRASTLIGAYQKPLARAIARQIRDVVPRYLEVDDTALVRNIELILDAIRPMLDATDDRRLRSVLSNVMDMRQAAGFSGSDFIVAALCGLPVLRRFLIERSPDAAEGLRLYESCEGLLLPLVGFIADTYCRLAREDATFPDGVSLRGLFSAQGLLETTERYEVEPVLLDDNVG
jgi:hypothetical protein